MSGTDTPTRLRIALISHGGFERHDTGVDVPYLTQMAAGLAERHDVTVITLRSRKYSCPSPRAGRARIRFASRATVVDPFLRVLLLAGTMTSLHRVRPFDVVHAIWALPSGLAAVLAARPLRVPVVVSFHGAETASLPLQRYGNMRGQPHASLTRYVARHASALTLLSTHQLRACESRNLRARTVHVIPPGTDTTLFRYATSRKCEPPLHLLHVGNLTGVKDQETLFQAFGLIKRAVRATLRIVGMDAMNGAMQALASDMGLEKDVAFTGFVPYEIIPAHHAWADMMLVSSRHEAGGVAVAEALASGLPVCGTETGILDDLNGSCLVAVPPGDPHRLAAATLRLYSNPDDRERLRAAGRAWAEANDIATAVCKVEEMYAHTLTRRPPLR